MRRREEVLSFISECKVSKVTTADVSEHLLIFCLSLVVRLVCLNRVI